MKTLALLLIAFTTLLEAQNILLANRGGIFYAPVVLNDKVHLEFVIDSGASNVHIPNYVFEQLKANGSVTNSDIIGKGKGQVANGDIIDITIINIRKLKIGDTEIENVTAGVGGDMSSLLLGQSALAKLEPWSLDTKKGILSIASAKTSNKMYLSSSQKISRREALDFINHYMSLEGSRDLEATMALYGTKVSYLNHGVLPIESISKLKEGYFREWQRIDTTMIKLIDIKHSPSHPGQITIKYSATFDLYSDFAHKGRVGQSLNTLTLSKSNGSIKILSQKVKILSQNSY